jgi:hypothetical protein
MLIEAKSIIDQFSLLESDQILALLRIKNIIRFDKDANRPNIRFA